MLAENGIAASTGEMNEGCVAAHQGVAFKKIGFPALNSPRRTRRGRKVEEIRCSMAGKATALILS